MGEMHPLPLNLLAPRDLSRGTLGSWSPIETAPKNVPVLVFDGHAISVAERCIGRWYALVGDKTVRREDRSMAVVKPTCWMPLPDPPGTSPRSESQRLQRGVASN
jgi:hypothetical protein